MQWKGGGSDLNPPPLPMLSPFFLLQSLAVVILVVFPVIPSSGAAAVTPHHYCTPTVAVAVAATATATADPTLCTAFRSPPGFPFGFSPGCGHPSFQIQCSSNRSLISINSSTFLLRDLRLDYLLLFPPPPSDDHHRLSASPCAVASAALPPHPIDLSGTPFRFSNLSCHRLSSIRPSLLHHDCVSLSKWHLRLLSRPLLLLKGCDASISSSTAAGGTQSEVTASILDFLKSGIRVEWDPTGPYFSSCKSCIDKFGNSTAACGFNDTDPSKPFLCLGFRPPSSHHHHQPTRLVLLTTTLFAVTCLSILAVSAAAVFRRRGGAPAGGTEDPMTAFLRRHYLQLQPPVFTYDQLRAYTDGFDPKRKIGDGGFGSVYLARLDDGRAAAVKRLHRHQPAATTKSFCNEILILSSIQHPHLVRLHGYCCDPRGLLLVYDYVPNGTLADHLHRIHHKNPPLTWPVRVDVALQIASALEYLHFSVKPPVVHRDITSSNIFVDRDMRVKVGDFGLSRLLSLPDPNSSGGFSSTGSSSSEFVCTGPQGTPGYLDPEYHRSFRLTEKSDVYSFGVVLLELVTGMKAVDLRRDKRDVSLADLVVSKIQVGELHQVVDPDIVRQGKAVLGTVEAVAELAFRCVAEDKDDRPDARELVVELKRIQCRTQEDSKGI